MVQGRRARVKPAPASEQIDELTLRIRSSDGHHRHARVLLAQPIATYTRPPLAAR